MTTLWQFLLYSLIQRGSSGPDVALVQTWLNGIRDSCTWYAVLTVDGRLAQTPRRLSGSSSSGTASKEDGKVGANTWNVLYARYTARHGLTVPYPGIVLRSGSAGGCVRLVQQKLNTEGERLTTDGKFGASTVAAVKRYQTRHSLTSDGSVGKDTWGKGCPAA